MFKKSLGQIGSTDQSQVQSQFLFLHILASFPKILQKFPKIFKNLDVFEKDEIENRFFSDALGEGSCSNLETDQDETSK